MLPNILYYNKKVYICHDFYIPNNKKLFLKIIKWKLLFIITSESHHLNSNKTIPLVTSTLPLIFL